MRFASSLSGVALLPRFAALPASVYTAQEEWSPDAEGAMRDGGERPAERGSCWGGISPLLERFM